MASIQNQILNHIIDIKEDVGGIKDHLGTLNGTVARHQERMDKHEDKIQKINIQMAKWVGMATVVGCVIHFGLSTYLL